MIAFCPCPSLFVDLVRFPSQERIELKPGPFVTPSLLAALPPVLDPLSDALSRSPSSGQQVMTFVKFLSLPGAALGEAGFLSFLNYLFGNSFLMWPFMVGRCVQWTKRFPECFTFPLPFHNCFRRPDLRAIIAFSFSKCSTLLGAV